MHLNKHRKSRGFTLIELLIVMVIIGILATIGIGNFRSARAKARDARRKSDLETIAKALEAYYNDYRQYPKAGSNHQIICIEPDQECPWGAEFKDIEGTVYTAKLPEDPAGHEYAYYSNNSDNYQTFFLYAALDNLNDPIIPNDLSSFPPTCGVNTQCNYLVTSSNTSPPTVAP